MLDYTYDGVPVSKVSTTELQNCLTQGIFINDGGPDTEEVREAVRERIRIELIARGLGL